MPKWVPVVLSLAALLAVPAVAAAQEGDSYLEFLLARRLEQDGDVKGALAALERAAAADPKSAEIRAELAAFHMRQNDAAAAEQAAGEALSRNPQNIEAHRVLGLVYSAYAESAAENGQEAKAPEFTKTAIEHLEKVAATPGGGTDVNLQFNLGRLYLRSGDNEKAIERLTRVLEQNSVLDSGAPGARAGARRRRAQRRGSGRAGRGRGR